MKKILFLLTMLILMSSCTSTELEVDPARYTPLTIGVLEYDADTDNSRMHEMQIGETVTTQIGCMYGTDDTYNINLYFAYNGGTCTLVSDNEDVQISRGQNAELFTQENFPEWEKRTFGFEDSLNNEGYFAINPFGSVYGHVWLYTHELEIFYNELRDEPAGREYWLTATAFDQTEKKTIVTAKLKIVQRPYEKKPEIAKYDKSTLFDITLVEYTLDDMYRMMLERNR